METERRAFLEAIEKDRYDRETRLVFADWLEERGEDDEAVEQRRRATEEWKEADEVMTELTRVLAESDGQEPTVEEIIQAGQNWVNGGDWQCVSGNGYEAENFVSDDENCNRFWKYWQIWTGKTVEEEKQGALFGCSC
jgi:uncharacterized protein (TIGR02996 family)